MQRDSFIGTFDIIQDFLVSFGTLRGYVLGLIVYLLGLSGYLLGRDVIEWDAASLSGMMEGS